MPFINNAHCKDIRQIIHQHDLPILVVFTPGLKLINHLTTSALEKRVCDLKSCPLKSTSCFIKNTIYQISCKYCDEIYIGETQRELHLRLKEHLKSILLCDDKSAMSVHFKHFHTHVLDEFPFTTQILDIGKDFVDRKLREATWIRKKKPSINRDIGWGTSTPKLI